MGVNSGSTIFNFHFYGSDRAIQIHFLRKEERMMWILRMNMNDRTYRLEEVPQAYKNLGGRGMTSTLVHDGFLPCVMPSALITSLSLLLES